MKIKVDDIMIQINGEEVSLKSLLEKLLERVDTSESSIESAEYDINHLNDQIEYDLRYKVSSLEDDVKDIERKVDNLDRRIDY